MELFVTRVSDFDIPDIDTIGIPIIEHVLNQEKENNKGKQYSIEVKNRANGAEFGQKRLIPVKSGKQWEWGWAPKVKDEDITKYYTKLGVLDYLNNKKIIPNKYRKSDSQLTYEDVKEDQKNFEDVTYAISDETISMFYKEKADYIQIGNGFGLYHSKTDKAKLGTEKFKRIFAT